MLKMKQLCVGVKKVLRWVLTKRKFLKENV